MINYQRNTKIEYIYGLRQSGKTSDLLSKINNAHEIIGIIVNSIEEMKKFRALIPFHMGVRYFMKPKDAFGIHCHKVFIDDAESKIIDPELLHIIADSAIPEGCVITYYFNSPAKNFSVKILEPKEKV